ncbi:hypothetical protein [Blautia obeum]|uniref:hypothetical protein n=1 Tax=Blautia obeum TaxID=40520 RepID=UPI001291A09E
METTNQFFKEISILVMEIVNQETEAIIELKLKVLINDKNGVVCEHKNYLNCIEDIEGGSYEKEYNKN